MIVKIIKNFLSSFYSLDSISLFWLTDYSWIAWIDKLHNCVQRICFMFYQGNREKTLSHFSWERLQREKNASSIIRILQIRTTTEVLGEKNVAISKSCILRKKEQRLKKHFNLNFLTTFHKTFTFHLHYIWQPSAILLLKRHWSSYKGF